MQLLTALCVLSLIYRGGGVTKSSSGISDFWTDDYKVFEQIYGKTSDRDLYGATLPGTSADDGKRTRATEKKERYIDTKPYSDFDSSSFGDRYAKLFAKQILGNEEKTTKPPKTFNFISYSDFKPISQHSDPVTYNYLKHLEEYDKEKHVKLPKGTGGFRPFLNHDNDSEDSQAYKSIQDILDAHEANKGSKNENDERDEQIQYLAYGVGAGKKKSNARKKPGGEKPRCWSGRCRKRAAGSIRVRSRPYIRKIIQNRWH